MRHEVVYIQLKCLNPEIGGRLITGKIWYACVCGLTATEAKVCLYIQPVPISDHTGWLLQRKELPTRQIANFILESGSELYILTGFCRFTASSKDD